MTGGTPQGHMVDCGQVVMVVGDGRQGYAAEGPYDAIHVGASASRLPQALGTDSSSIFSVSKDPVYWN